MDDGLGSGTTTPAWPPGLCDIGPADENAEVQRRFHRRQAVDSEVRCGPRQPCAAAVGSNRQHDHHLGHGDHSVAAVPAESGAREHNQHDYARLFCLLGPGRAASFRLWRSGWWCDRDEAPEAVQDLSPFLATSRSRRNPGGYSRHCPDPGLNNQSALPIRPFRARPPHGSADTAPARREAGTRVHAGCQLFSLCLRHDGLKAWFLLGADARRQPPDRLLLVRYWSLVQRQPVAGQ
mmetsp:Transcript_1007/g.2289  ORF Transcript_1007/g.2289 Transcript_1007/m.2289 type:complete len:236 (+) Transcript_1007:462-1169(+)